MLTYRLVGTTEASVSDRGGHHHSDCQTAPAYGSRRPTRPHHLRSPRRAQKGSGVLTSTADVEATSAVLVIKVRQRLDKMTMNEDSYREAITSSDEVTAQWGRYNLACLLEEQGELTEAESLYRSVATASSPETSSAAKSQLGRLAARRGDHAEAETFYRQAMAVDSQSSMIAIAALRSCCAQRGAPKKWSRCIARCSVREPCRSRLRSTPIGRTFV